jgi:hypothetical protein
MHKKTNKIVTNIYDRQVDFKISLIFLNNCINIINYTKTVS